MIQILSSAEVDTFIRFYNDTELTGEAALELSIERDAQAAADLAAD